MSHPHQLHAQAALWSLRAALRYLAEHRDAVVVRRPQLGPTATRPRSLAALHELDATMRSERAERAAGSLTGLKPSAGSTGPISPGLLDLDREIATTLDDVHGLIAHVHRNNPLLRWTNHWPRVLDEVFHIGRDARWTYLSAALPATPAGVAQAAAGLLEQADARVRAICDLHPDHLAPPLAPACPSCGVRRLRVQHSAPDTARWTVTCTAPGCRCRGDHCPCRMDAQPARARHIWAADSELAVSVLAGLRAVGLRLAA